MISGKKDVIKIFLAFFFLYSLFIYWGGQNENSRFALTRAIVDENRFEIDSFYNSTADRAFYNGHYYSDKNPGTSFLAVPAYSIWKFLNPAKKKPQNIEYLSFTVGSTQVYEPLRVGKSTLISMILVTISVPSLFGALLIATLFYFLIYFIPDRKFVFLMSILAGLGTAIFTYSTAFLEFILPAFFSFLSFLLVFRMKREKKCDPRILFLAGTLTGFSFVISILAYSVILGLLFYLYFSKVKRIQFFLLGLVIGISPLLMYNYTSFGTPFTHPIFYIDDSVLTEIQHKIKQDTFGYLLNSISNSPVTLIRGLFYPETGLFFYQPILILLPFGLFYFSKRYKNEAIFIALLFLFHTIGSLLFSYQILIVGAFFGQKIFVPIIPFLMIPILYLLYHFWRSKVKYLIILLSIYSIFITLSSLQPKIDPITDINAFSGKISSLEIYSNPLYNYYIPQLLQYGPRSRILERAINLQPIDIRFLTSKDREYFLYFYNYIPFLALFPISFSIALIGWNEFRKYKWVILSIPIILLVILGTPPKEPKEINFEKGFYPLSPFEGTRWLTGEGNISIYSPSSSIETKQLSVLLTSYYKNRTYDLLLNNESIDTGIVSYMQQLQYNWVLRLRPGKNTLTFRSDCDVPNIVEAQEDTRCLGIGVSNFNITVFNRSLLFSKGWHPQSPSEDVRWTLNDGEILINNRDNEKTGLFRFVARSFLSDRDVKLSFNRNSIDNFKIFIQENDIYTSVINLSKGKNTLEFIPLSECSIVSDTDSRCLSIGLKELDFIPLEGIINANTSYILSQNWYRKYPEDTVQWMNNDGTIIFFYYGTQETVKINLDILLPFLEEKNIEFYLNGEMKNIFTVVTSSYIVSTLPQLLKYGPNYFIFHVKEGCTVVDDILHNGDKRCFSMTIRNITLD